MTPIEELRARVDQLLSSNAARDELAKEARQGAMRVWEDRLALFDARVRLWMREIVLPRLKVLAERFPHAEPAKHSEGAPRASIHLPRTDEFPVDARVDARVVHDADFGQVRLILEASIIPILMDYEREASLELDLAADDALAVERFIEERIVRFVADYLRVLDPDSFYQKDRLVTDPVCGMPLRRAEAATIHDYGGRKYYFCIPNCREVFVADPARYIRMGHMPGSPAGGRQEIPGSPKEEER